MQSAELINRYVNAVGENLPGKSRADIQAELRSLLSEMLDARSETEGRPVDQAMTIAVLREFGEPAVVAQRYAPSRPLIGPAYFPIFATVVKIVAVVMIVIWAVGAALAIANSDGSLESILNILWSNSISLIGQLLANFGLIVIIFAVMEHYSAKPPVTGEPWDPVKLPAVENPNRVDRSDAIFTIIGNLVVLAILNFAPNLFNLFFVQSGELQTIPLFGPGFFQYLPLIYISCIIEIVLHAYVLFRGVWTRTTRILEIGSNLFAIIVITVLLAAPEPLAANSVFEPLVKLGLVSVLIIMVIMVVLEIYRLVTKRWNPPAAAELGLASNGQHS